MKNNRNLDFVYLAVIPFIAAMAFLVIYVDGLAPTVSLPAIGGPWGSALESLRQFASQNALAAASVAVAVVVGIIGFTWIVMVLLDAKSGAQALIHRALRRPPGMVSGILRPEYDRTWTASMGTANEPAKPYRAKQGSWLGGPPS
jgi:hypothetical protein